MIDKSSRQTRLERQRNEQRRSQTRWLVYVIIGAVVVAGLLIVSNLARDIATGPVVAPKPRTYGQQSGNVLGDPNAPVQLIEVGDFQCPVCKVAFEQLEEQIITQYVDTGKVSYTFEAVGYLDGPTNPESTHSAEAAYCAGDQNKFWEFHDFLYTNQAAAERSGGFADERLVAMAEALGLDMSAFNSCFQGGEKAALVDQAETTAAQFGISATPSFVINGQVMIGLVSFTEIQNAIEAALSASGG